MGEKRSRASKQHKKEYFKETKTYKEARSVYTNIHGKAADCDVLYSSSENVRLLRMKAGRPPAEWSQRSPKARPPLETSAPGST